MRSKQISNNTIHQVILISIIGLILVLTFTSLRFYLTGFLGAATLYILFRKPYRHFTIKKKWNKTLTSILFILISVLFVIIPLWALISYLVPQIINVASNTDQIIEQFNLVKTYMSSKPFLKDIDLSDEGLLNILQHLTKYLPSIFNSLAEVSVNIVVSLFVLYFMLVKGQAMEQTISNAIPFSQKSKDQIWQEVFLMVRSNALGIPILGLCQGVVAMIGYAIFGVENFITWGFLTGLSSVIPVLGTMTIYIPLGLIVLASGQTTNGIGILIYGLAIIGSIDNILRFTILKGLGDVPPLITVFGVLLGLNLFGMLGLIFGPLILSSIPLLIKVYNNEFGKTTPVLIIEPETTTASEEITNNEEKPSAE